MANMQEIINLTTFAKAIMWLAIALPVIGLVVGLLAREVGKGLAVGLLGTLIYVLWLVYSYLIRYDPVTGSCGLHRTAVLWLNIGLFALVGVALGAFYGWLFRGRRAPDDDTAGAAERHTNGA
ncbi:MAG: hypothetical protein ACYC63_07590 [Armatimonadota bacterium]